MARYNRSSYQDGNAAVDLYSINHGTTAPQMPPEPELPELSAERANAVQTVVVHARAEISAVAMLCAVVVVALLVMVISGYVRLYELTSVNTELNKQLDALTQEHNRLESLYEDKVDLEQIEHLATTELGMHTPYRSQIVYLDMTGEDSAVIFASDSANAGSVFMALKNALGYVVDYIRAYLS